jgi:hypothetical protein
MKSNYPILIALFGLGGYYLYKKFALGTSLDFTIKNIGIDGSLFSPILKLSLNVINHINASAQVNYISGNLYIDNTYSGQINQNVNQTIAANSVSELNLDIDLSVAGIFDIISNIKTIYAKQSVNFKFDGFVNADGINLPLVFTYAV